MRRILPTSNRSNFMLLAAVLALFGVAATFVARAQAPAAPILARELPSDDQPDELIS